MRLASAGRDCGQDSIGSLRLRLRNDQLQSLIRRQLACDDAALNRSIVAVRHKTFERDDGIRSLERGGHGCGIAVGRLHWEPQGLADRPQDCHLHRFAAIQFRTVPRSSSILPSEMIRRGCPIHHGPMS